MLPELGLFCLIIALTLALLQMGIYFSRLAALNIMRPIAIGQVLFVCLATSILFICLLSDDFSVRYVALNSNSLLPWYYKFTALWGAHEGSLLLWVLILNLWILAIVIASKKYTQNFVNGLLLAFSLINVGFLWLLLWGSNPFARILTDLPLDGMDLNPLLQDIGMILHPPILYTGYVGCSVAFAFGIAGLLTGKLNAAWAINLRPWVLIAWLFLTLGIALGSWWAYYELGWGGWWFWDPVENASFMPWLVCTALLHCLLVVGRQGQLLLLALFLSFVAFTLSILGTFLVRSGSIVSVHAFAADPKSGVWILLFLGTLIIFMLGIYLSQRHKLVLPAANKFVFMTATAGILLNNIILLIACGTILLGTIYPLLHEIIFAKSISVGYPYFNLMFIPLILLLCGLLCLTTTASKKHLMAILLCSALIAGVLLYLWFGSLEFGAIVGVVLGISIIAITIQHKNVAMILAHGGLAMILIGISVVSNYQIEKDLRFNVGEEFNIAGYIIKFEKFYSIEAANYLATVADFVINNSKHVATLQPQKRVYLAREMSTTETAIMPGFFEDIYIALGQQVAENSWTVRIYYKPLVRWIWLGAIVMAFGAAVGVGQRVRNVGSIRNTEMGSVYD